MPHGALGATANPHLSMLPGDPWSKIRHRERVRILKMLSRRGIVRYYIALIDPLLFFFHDGCDTLRSMLTRFQQCGYVNKCFLISILHYVAMSA